VEVLEVLQPGALTTIQDRGRYGYQQYGVSVSGAMDKFSLRVANLLVGNDGGAAALEITVIGPKLKFLRELQIAITGGDLSPQINAVQAPMWQALDLKGGDVLSFGPPKSGCRAYLAISGGIDIPLIMGSHSTHLLSKLGGLGRALAKGDVLEVKESKASCFRLNPAYRFPPDLIPVYGKEWMVRVVPGPQSDYFTHRGIETFLTSEYEITPQADRMGYRLKGPKIKHKLGADILTDATPPGSVQVPGDGMPIILLTDGQTTGGYSKIAVVITIDQDRLGQAKPGDKVRFQKISVVQAQRVLKEQEDQIQKIKRAALLAV